MPTPTQISLTDEERALARRAADRAVYVGVVYFRGPRGRRYRPVRTAAYVTEMRAREEAHRIRTRPYRGGPIVTGTDLLLCDPLGDVIEAEALGIGRILPAAD